jgi:hypothetical protein
MKSYENFMGYFNKYFIQSKKKSSIEVDSKTGSALTTGSK